MTNIILMDYFMDKHPDIIKLSELIDNIQQMQSIISSCGFEESDEVFKQLIDFEELVYCKMGEILNDLINEETEEQEAKEIEVTDASEDK